MLFFFFCYQIKKEKRKHWQAASEFTLLFYFSPQRTDFIFLCRRAEATAALCLWQSEAAALCYQGKGHLFKVSAWVAFGHPNLKVYSLTHHFYRIGGKSDVQILQREKQRGLFRHRCAVSSGICPFCWFSLLGCRLNWKKGCLPIWNTWTT